MPRRLAVKRLTESDLTIFEFHHRRTAGKQKAINLNADVFIDELYPQLPELAPARNGRFPVDLYLYGPAYAGEYNLQRKILKFGSYKNWRLDGEFIHNPSDEPERFNRLVEGDFAVFEFVGDVTPDVCKVVFIGQQAAEDSTLHGLIETLMAGRRMARLRETELEPIVDQSRVAQEHPIHGLLLEASLEDAVYFGEQGTSELLRQPSVRSLSRTDLDLARQSAEDSGDLGEEFVNSYLSSELTAGRLSSFEWVSQFNAIAPFDFTATDDTGSVEIDAKSTTGGFERRIHVSISELRRMALSAARYDIYRVYGMNGGVAQLRICRDMKTFAQMILDGMSHIPAGVTVDSVSIDPQLMAFGEAITLTLEAFEE